MQQAKTSGIAISSLILGILGLFCVPFAGVFSVVLGVFGLRQVKRSDGRVSGSGLAISGIVLGAANVVLSGVAVALLVVGAVYAKPRPTMDVLPTYESLIGEEFSGSGFHFEWDGRRYIGCSLHQFEGGTPGQMLWGHALKIVPVVDRVHVQTDIQILAYDESALAGSEPLIYLPGVRVRRNERVLVMADNEALLGTMMYTIPDHDGLVYLELDRPIPLQGHSGSAIVSGVTGTVVGVLLNGVEEEGIVGFELLDLPESLRGTDRAGP